MKINPWSSTTYQDYARLRDEFGIETFTEEDWHDLPHPHHLLRRNVIFGHRDFSKIHDAVLQKKPWAILTGLMPSGRMHLGHKMVIDEVIYYQSIGADIFISVADIEAFATRGISLQETKKLALEEYIINYIALGLQPERCHLYFQSTNQYVKDLGYLLGKKVNWSQMIATYGFDGSTNMAHIFSPLIQTGDILHVQLPEFGGIRPTLVPVGVDQDPHIRLSRDIAQAHRLYNVIRTKDNRIGIFVKIDTRINKLLDNAEKLIHRLGFSKIHRISKYKALYIDDASEEDIPKLNKKLAASELYFEGYGFLQPCSTYHRFITGLDGEKMSSSKPGSAIFLTDTAEEARKKILHAKTGGAVTLAEQKRRGGSPDICVVYELFLYHLIENDKDLEQIYCSCEKGERMCGACKKQAADLMSKMLADIHTKRKMAQGKIKDFISEF